MTTGVHLRRIAVSGISKTHDHGVYRTDACLSTSVQKLKLLRNFPFIGVHRTAAHSSHCYSWNNSRDVYCIKHRKIKVEAVDLHSFPLSISCQKWQSSNRFFTKGKIVMDQMELLPYVSLASKNTATFFLNHQRLLSSAQLPNSPEKSESSTKRKIKESSAKRISGARENVQRAKETIQETVKDFDVVMTIPNILTMTRMALSPVLGYLVIQEAYTLACGLFLFAGFTDVLDGWIARTFPSQASAFGSFIDPLADKLLVSILCVTLTWVGLIPVPLTALILARDTCLIIGAFYIRYITLPPPKTIRRYFQASLPTAELKPTLISKINTALQVSLLAFTIAAPVFSYVDHPGLHALWYLTAGTTFASGVGYMMFAKDAFKVIKQSQKKS